MSFYAWKPRLSVAERRKKSEMAVAKMKKAGKPVAPVVLAGRAIASTFWGKAWCDNLERYSDFESRLPRGRSYVRNGSVIDLQIAKEEITAAVMGSDVYTIRISIVPVDVKRWKAICEDCAGSIDSLVELLQGKLAKGVMDRVCRQGDGLFPGPAEIKLSCSCPDWADMCKHVAAVLYGVGSRLDEQPGLLFTLRGVDEKDLVAGADGGPAVAKPRQLNRKLLKDADLASVFGLELADGAEAGARAPLTPTTGRKGARSKRKAKAAVKLPAIVKSTAKARGAKRASRAKKDVAGAIPVPLRSAPRGKRAHRKSSPATA